MEPTGIVDERLPGLLIDDAGGFHAPSPLKGDDGIVGLLLESVEVHGFDEVPGEGESSVQFGDRVTARTQRQWYSFERLIHMDETRRPNRTALRAGFEPSVGFRGARRVRP